MYDYWHLFKLSHRKKGIFCHASNSITDFNWGNKCWELPFLRDAIIPALNSIIYLTKSRCMNWLCQLFSPAMGDASMLPWESPQCRYSTSFQISQKNWILNSTISSTLTSVYFFYILHLDLERSLWINQKWGSLSCLPVCRGNFALLHAVLHIRTCLRRLRLVCSIRRCVRCDGEMF